MRSRYLSPLIAAVALALAACGGDDETPTATVVVQPPSTTTEAEAPPTDKPEEQPPAEPGPTPSSGPAESAGFDPRVNERERDAARAVREYVAALDSRDGAAACALLVPGALDEVELPEERDDCASSLAASIGYRDPRGLPVWKGARVADVQAIELAPDGAEARVVATVVTTFADREEVSIEDDVVYLVRSGGAWLVAKPSATLYRAVGIADVPPSVLTPPN